MLKTFASIQELLTAAEQQGIETDPLQHRSDLSWYNNETLATTLNYTRHGNQTLVPTAETLIAQLDTQIETPRRIWEDSIAGMFPNVPAAINGQPCTMRRLVETGDERAAIALLVITTSSAGLTAPILAKRGAVILALVLILARIRPISLNIVSILDGGDADGETIISTRVETAPLSLGEACYVLTSAGFDRRIHHFLSRKYNHYQGLWPRNYGQNKEAYHQYLTDLLSYQHQQRTLLIAESHLTDELIAQPVTWLQNQVKRFTQREE